MSDVEFLELLQCLALDGPTHAGGALEPLVMKNDDMSIAGQLAIHLDHVGTGFDRLLKSQTSIFRKIAGGAAVGYFDKSGHKFSLRSMTNTWKDLSLLTVNLACP